MTPVGISQIAMATRKIELTSMTSKMLSPPTCMRKIVLAAHINDVASVNKRLDVR